MKNKYFIYTATAVTAYFLFMSLFALWKYWGYMHSIYDIGNMVQPIWNFLEEGKPLSTLAPPHEEHNRFGFHFTPIILLLTPIYILAGAEGLVVSHVFFISITAFVIYAIAQELKFSYKNSFIIAVIFLLNPFIVNGLFWDFRPLSIGCLLVALSYLFLLRRNFFALLLTCGLLLTVKESFGIYIAGFGLIWAFYNKDHLKGFGLFAGGLLAAYLIVFQLMPCLLGADEHAMLAKGAHSVNRYFWIFEPYEEMRKYFDYIFLSSLTPYIYIFLLLAAFLFTPLAAFVFLLPAGGDVLLNLLSYIGLPKAYFSYHSLAIIPCLLVASLIYLKNSDVQEKVVKYILYITITLSFLLAPFPLLINANVWQQKSFISYPDQNIPVIKNIVGDKAVSAQVNIGGNFVERKYIYPYPEQIEKSDYIILHNYAPTTNLAFMSINPQEEVEKLLQDEQFKLVYDAQNWKVFERVQ